jgi:hypothetical protein
MNIDGIDFHFPQGWETAEYDKWRFYRKQFQNAVIGHKGVDVIAINNRNILWLIELKDYRRHPRKKVIDLAEEVALKVRDTLAGIMAAASAASSRSWCWPRSNPGPAGRWPSVLI